MPSSCVMECRRFKVEYRKEGNGDGNGDCQLPALTREVFTPRRKGAKNAKIKKKKEPARTLQGHEFHHVAVGPYKFLGTRVDDEIHVLKRDSAEKHGLGPGNDYGVQRRMPVLPADFNRFRYLAGYPLAIGNPGGSFPRNPKPQLLAQFLRKDKRHRAGINYRGYGRGTHILATDRPTLTILIVGSVFQCNFRINSSHGIPLNHYSIKQRYSITAWRQGRGRETVTVTPA